MKKIILAILVLFTFPSISQAESRLSVEPAILEISYGEKNAIVNVTNTGDETLHISYEMIYLQPQSNGMLIPQPFSKKPEGITIINLLPEEFSLEPGSNKQLKINIANQIQSELIPGVFIYTAVQEVPTDKTTTSLSGSIVVPIVQLGHISTQTVVINPIKTPFFTSQGGLNIELELLNPSYTSNIVSGSIRVKNILGKEVAAQEFTDTILLPKSKKSVLTYTWNPALFIGIYKIHTTVKVGDKVIQKNKIVVGVPVPYTISISIIILFTTGIYLRVRKYRH